MIALFFGSLMFRTFINLRHLNHTNIASALAEMNNRLKLTESDLMFAAKAFAKAIKAIKIITSEIPNLAGRFVSFFSTTTGAKPRNATWGPQSGTKNISAAPGPTVTTIQKIDSGSNLFDLVVSAKQNIYRSIGYPSDVLVGLVI